MSHRRRPAKRKRNNLRRWKSSGQTLTLRMNSKERQQEKREEVDMFKLDEEDMNWDDEKKGKNKKNKKG